MTLRKFGFLLVLIFLGRLAGATEIDSSQGQIVVSEVLSGLDEPWSVGFLPNGSFLVTELVGRLLFVTQDGAPTSVSGVPKVASSGQGGLLDVMVPRDFDTSRQIYLSFARPSARGAGTALAVGQLSKDGSRLTGLKVIFEMTRGNTGGRHFGSRIVEGEDGYIYLTIGERGNRPLAQDLSRHNGSVIRINRNGSVPADNPFVDVSGAQPEIWSYGHRNPQGSALDLHGQLWVHEHGARGGDEINKINKGANYGWPVIAYGRHYTGGKIGEGTAKPGMEQPAHYWDPSIAPSGMMFYSGALWPEWRGDVFVGSLKFDYIARLDPDRGWAEEVLRNTDTARVRDIREAPDGSIWFLSVGNGTLYRMTPK